VPVLEPVAPEPVVPVLEPVAPEPVVPVLEPVAPEPVAPALEPVAPEPVVPDELVPEEPELELPLELPDPEEVPVVCEPDELPEFEPLDDPELDPPSMTSEFDEHAAMTAAMDDNNNNNWERALIATFL